MKNVIEDLKKSIKKVRDLESQLADATAVMKLSDEYTAVQKLKEELKIAVADKTDAENELLEAKQTKLDFATSKN